MSNSTTKFGLWTVVGRKLAVDGRVPYVIAKCSCGTMRSVSLQNLRSGKSKSCGCHRRARTSEQKTVHGDARKGHYTPEYGCCRWATPAQQRANQRKRLRIEQFTTRDLIAELRRRGYHNPLRVPQHH